VNACCGLVYVVVIAVSVFSVSSCLIVSPDEKDSCKKMLSKSLDLTCENTYIVCDFPSSDLTDLGSNVAQTSLVHKKESSAYGHHDTVDDEARKDLENSGRHIP